MFPFNFSNNNQYARQSSQQEFPQQDVQENNDEMQMPHAQQAPPKGFKNPWHGFQPQPQDNRYDDTHNDHNRHGHNERHDNSHKHDERHGHGHDNKHDERHGHGKNRNEHHEHDNNYKKWSPSAAPPSFTPEKRSPSVYAIDPGSIKGCINGYTYVWLSNRQSFWMYITYIGYRSIAGYRWGRYGWVYAGYDIKNIESFYCMP